MALALIFGIVALVLGGLAFWQYQERVAAEARANEHRRWSGAASLLRGVLVGTTGGAGAGAGLLSGLLGGGSAS